MKFLVAQIGARHGYAVPEALARAGLLERFYTDACASRGLGRLASTAARLGPAAAPVRRLAGRTLPQTLRGRTRTFDLVAARHFLQSRLGARTPAAQFKRTLDYGWRLGQAMGRAGFGSATHLYSMLMEPGPLLAQARRHGLAVVSEIYILLSSERIVREERLRFPGWEADEADFAALGKSYYPTDPLLPVMDLAVCPSEAVRRDLVENFSFPYERTAVVPYGVEPAWLEPAPATEPGRVLFAGTACLRKGIHYLAAAAARLCAAGRRYEFVVAGDASPQIRERPECRALEFLGRLPRAQLIEQFRRADLLVLPSLAEGSAEVTYQALGAGLPLVTTAATGSVARHEREGLIVPERDAAALAVAIDRVVQNRALREALSAAARRRVAEFTWDRFAQAVKLQVEGCKLQG